MLLVQIVLVEITLVQMLWLKLTWCKCYGGNQLGSSAMVEMLPGANFFGGKNYGAN